MYSSIFNLFFKPSHNNVFQKTILLLKGISNGADDIEETKKPEKEVTVPIVRVESVDSNTNGTDSNDDKLVEKKAQIVIKTGE